MSWKCVNRPPQRAIVGLRIIILRRLATNFNFTGQQ